MMDRITCLIVESDPEAVRQIDNLCREPRGAAPTLRARRAGANVSLQKPVKEIDMRAAAEKVFKLKASQKETQAGLGKILTVFSNKGGNGVTTVVANLP